MSLAVVIFLLVCPCLPLIAALPLLKSDPDAPKTSFKLHF